MKKKKKSCYERSLHRSLATMKFVDDILFLQMIMPNKSFDPISMQYSQLLDLFVLSNLYKTVSFHSFFALPYEWSDIAWVSWEFGVVQYNQVNRFEIGFQTLTQVFSYEKKRLEIFVSIFLVLYTLHIAISIFDVVNVIIYGFVDISLLQWFVAIAFRGYVYFGAWARHQ